MSPSTEALRTAAPVVQTDSAIARPNRPMSDAGSCANISTGNTVDPSVATCVIMTGSQSVGPGSTLSPSCLGYGPLSGVPNAVFLVAAGHTSSWSVGDTHIITVSKNAQDYTATVTGVAPGTTWVNCKINSATQSMNVTVTGTRVIVSVTVGKSNTCPATIYPGTQCQLLAGYTDQYGQLNYVQPTTHSWTSQTPGICSVDSNTGLMVGVAAGTCTITLTADGHSGSITLTVTAANQLTLTISGPTQIELLGPETYTVSPTGFGTTWYYTSNGGASWSAIGTGNSVTLNPGANDPDFDLKAVVNQTGYTGQQQIHVNLDQPLEARLGASINDPANTTLSVGSDTTVTFIVTAGGGVAPLHYSWEISYPTYGTGWGPIGTNSPSLSIGVLPTDGQINVRVTVTSATGTTHQPPVVTERDEYIINMSGGSGCIIC